MKQNDFYVAIQGILTDAHEQGWSIDWTLRNGQDAIGEWEEEMAKVLNPIGDSDD